MAPNARPTPSIGIISVLCTLLVAIISPVQCLHFYMDGTAPKCFYEELPKDTLVVGKPDTKQYEKHDGIQIFISVDEVFHNDHRVVSQKGSSKGRFTFTAADSGEHKICVTPSSGSSGGWLTGGSGLGGIKLTLDMAVGETSAIESTDKGKILDIVARVKDLNSRLTDIRREQIFQREREAEFRDQSESTNARVVRWTLIQLAVLGVT
ncbi:MAG: emp24p/erv25p- protein, partial [Lichina confinis]